VIRVSQEYRIFRFKKKEKKMPILGRYEYTMSIVFSYLNKEKYAHTRETREAQPKLTTNPNNQCALYLFGRMTITTDQERLSAPWPLLQVLLAAGYACLLSARLSCVVLLATGARR
jgi:hypothetical protein